MGSTRMVTASFRDVVAAPAGVIYPQRGSPSQGKFATAARSTGRRTCEGPAERLLRRARRPLTAGQLAITVTSPMPSSLTGSAITEASPTRTVTRRSGGNAATTASVAAAVPSSASSR